MSAACDESATRARADDFVRAHGSGGVPGTCGSLKTDLEAEHKELQDDLDDFKVYPVLSFGLQYRF